jgi:hypothetical protein
MHRIFATALVSATFLTASPALARVPTVCESDYQATPLAAYETEEYIVNICRQGSRLQYVGFAKSDPSFRTVLEASRVNSPNFTGYTASEGDYTYAVISYPDGSGVLQVRELTSGGINSLILEQAILEAVYY